MSSLTPLRFSPFFFCLYCFFAYRWYYACVSCKINCTVTYVLHQNHLPHWRQRWDFISGRNQQSCKVVHREPSSQRNQFSFSNECWQQPCSFKLRSYFILPCEDQTFKCRNKRKNTFLNGQRFKLFRNHQTYQMYHIYYQHTGSVAFIF